MKAKDITKMELNSNQNVQKPFWRRTQDQLSQVQTDATLLDDSCCVHLHTLLFVFGCCCCAKFEIGVSLIKLLQVQFTNVASDLEYENNSYTCKWLSFWANYSEHFFCSVIAEAKRNNIGSVCTVLSPLLGPRTRFTHGFQDLQPRTQASSRYPSYQRRLGTECVFDKLDRWRHIRNRRRRLGTRLGKCCIRLHTTANTDATTPTLFAQQFWELTRRLYVAMSTKGN